MALSFDTAPSHSHARKILSAVMLVAGLLVGPASASAGDPKPAPVNACAQQGEGFFQVPGTTTCVRTTSRIRVDAGRSESLTNAPNQGATGDVSSSSAAPSDPWKQAR